jgi:hypothetical protein
MLGARRRVASSPYRQTGNAKEQGMDGPVFDELTRGLAPGTRRGFLGGLGGSTVAGLLGGIGLNALFASEAAAKKKKKKKKKKGGCKGNESCGEGRICILGTCVTGSGTCPEPASICASSPFTETCNGNANCHCYIKVGGATRCGTKASASACGTCTTNEQCASFGTGAACVIPEVACDGCDAGQGFCIKPCPS